MLLVIGNGAVDYKDADWISYRELFFGMNSYLQIKHLVNFVEKRTSLERGNVKCIGSFLARCRKGPTILVIEKDICTLTPRSGVSNSRD